MVRETVSDVAISIHAPCTGSDTDEGRTRERRKEFQSTLPARGATARGGILRKKAHISIHAPCTGSDDCTQRHCFVRQHFNPRSLHGERQPLIILTTRAREFQSTLPARGATRTDYDRLPDVFKISIHAPCTGSDTSRRITSSSWNNFNPRSLHGERPVWTDKFFYVRAFQSTLPARGATSVAHDAVRRKIISIHAPCTGSDWFGIPFTTDHCLFQSTLPARGATRILLPAVAATGISIHAPCTGSDKKLPVIPTSNYTISIHAPCTGSDQRRLACGLTLEISIHAPCTGSDCVQSRCKGKKQPFQSTLPARGATVDPLGRVYRYKISIHAPCTGSDTTSSRIPTLARLFQSTLPARGATPCRHPCECAEQHFNPRSLHGERPL